MASIVLLNSQEKTREQIRTWLTAAGHSVEAPTEPRSILNGASAVKPDLVIIDIDLGCIDGLYIAEKLGTEDSTPDIPILMTAGSYDMLALLDAIERGASEFLSLPVSEDKLNKKINSILSKK